MRSIVQPRAPVRQTPTRAEPEEATVATNAPKKKTRIRKNAAMRSLLDLPAGTMEMLHANGIDVQWCTDSVLGQAAPQTRMAFEINGWEPVTPDMFDGLFDGMYTRKGHQGEINYEGLVLMWRPLELTQEAQEEDRQARDAAIMAQQNMIKGGAAIQGLARGFEPVHATVKNKLTRTIKPPMEIPAD